MKIDARSQQLGWLSLLAPGLLFAAPDFAVGERVEIEASGHWLPCVVSENNPEFVMRVHCEAVPELSRAAGVYMVDRDNPLAVRKSGSSPPPAPAPAPSVSASPGSAGSDGLREGEYACYGSGGRILAGLSFKVLPGGRYTDLDEASSGTFVLTGNTVRFHGGHMDGSVGSELSNQNFRIGQQASCEPF